MKTIIVGAGIGGLTTAIALQKAGIDFEIFEAAPELKPLGAGIVMASNAMQVFQRLGMEKKIMDAGVEIVNAYGVDQSFKLISGLAVKEKITTRYGIGSYAIHRGRLQEILLAEIPASKIHLGKRLSGLRQADGVTLQFEDGSSMETDLAIGADGIRSAVRKSIFGDIPLRYSGQTCWRGMAKFRLPDAMRFNSYEMWGDQKGLRFGFVPTAENEVYYFTTFFADAYGKDEPGRAKSTLIDRYSCFGEVPVKLIGATADEYIIRSDIFDFQPQGHWWKGRVALIGDAAHATTPNLGQGGCQAVEDAFVIAQCLHRTSSIEKAFDQYQTIRYKKAVDVVNLSWHFGKMTNLGSPVLRSLRNGLMRMIPETMAIRQLDKILRLNY